MLAHCAQSAEQQLGPASCPVAQVVAEKPEDASNASYNRKDKSLGLLCDRFLAEYRDASEVCLLHQYRTPVARDLCKEEIPFLTACLARLDKHHGLAANFGRGSSREI
jgi:hypothetical protein